MQKEQGAAAGAPLGVSRGQANAYHQLTHFPAIVDLSENGALICPACNFNHAHLSQSITPYTADDRSYGWVIEVQGECGHAFILVIRQYKGQVQILTPPPGVLT